MNKLLKMQLRDLELQNKSMALKLRLINALCVEPYEVLDCEEKPYISGEDVVEKLKGVLNA